MSDLQYTYAVARIRTLENYLFSASTIEQLLMCKDHESRLRFLQEKGWGSSDTPFEQEAILSREQEKIWETLRELRVDMSIFDVLFYPKWFHNLKAAIKAVYTGNESQSIFYEGTPLSGSELMHILKERDFQSLPQYMESVAKEAMEILFHSGDGQLCDVIIDRGTMEAIQRAGENSNEPMIREYAQWMVAMTNIKIAIRGAKTKRSMEFLKRAMVPCGLIPVEKLAMAALNGMDAVVDVLEENGFSDAAEALGISQAAFECWCDDRIMSMIRLQKMNAFSVGPIVAYAIARENEIKTVRIILTCRQNGLGEDAIRERIREMYV